MKSEKIYFNPNEVAAIGLGLARVIEAINRGEPIWLQIYSFRLPPMAVFTLDENGNSNDAG